MSGESDLARWDFLASDRGEDLLNTLADRTVRTLASLEIVTELRSQGYDASEVSAALSQAALRKRAHAKFGDATARMLFTEAGLEQATRSVVAERHAKRFREANLTAVADLGCGIGAESRAFASAGLSVTAVERDPITARIAAFNLRQFPNATVVIGDAETTPLAPGSAVFLDPARRTAGHSNTVRLASSDQYSPSLTFAFKTAQKHPLAIKLGPGFDRSEIPAEADAEWTSVDGDAVEMMLWFGPLRLAGQARAATVIRGDTAHQLTASQDAADATVRELGSYLFEPDPAVIRARLIGLLAEQHDLGMLNERIAYLTGDTPLESPFLSGFRVREILPVNETKLKKALRVRNIGTLEIKKRGMDVDPAALRKRLALRGDESATLILTRTGADRVAILAERLAATS